MVTSVLSLFWSQKWRLISKIKSVSKWLKNQLRKYWTIEIDSFYDYYDPCNNLIYWDIITLFCAKKRFCDWKRFIYVPFIFNLRLFSPLYAWKECICFIHEKVTIRGMVMVAAIQTTIWQQWYIPFILYKVCGHDVSMSDTWRPPKYSNMLSRSPIHSFRLTNRSTLHAAANCQEISVSPDTQTHTIENKNEYAPYNEKPDSAWNFTIFSS